MPSQKGIGTAKTGFATAENGPFECEHCVWFEAPRLCGHPEVIADPQMRQQNGKAIVSRHSCCNEFRPLKKLVDITFEEAGI